MLIQADKIKQIEIDLNENQTGKISDLYFDDLFWRIRYIGIAASRNNKINFIVLSGYYLTDLSNRSEFLPGLHQLNFTAENESQMALKHWQQFPEEQTNPGQEWPLVKLPRGSISDARLFQIFDSIYPFNQKSYHYLQSHLRTQNAIIGLDINAENGPAGKVGDIIIEVHSWKIRYLMVYVSEGSQSGKDVIISPTWIKKIEWQNNNVFLDLKKQAIFDSPAYNPDKPLTNEFELKVLRHYSHARSGFK